MTTDTFEWPDIIKNLPDVDVPFSGVYGKLLQGKDCQQVFFEIEPIGEIPPHSHGAQWGVVLGGEMMLTIEGNTKKYGKGDSYYIPAGAVHSANFLTKVFAIDFFDDKNRYSQKSA